jgi:CheY-like chemotaxis protein
MDAPEAISPSRSILVVEDNASIREALRDILTMEGYGVAEAENGRVALHHLFREPAPSLIILDLVMPEMSGSEFLWAARRHVKQRRVPIVLLSALRGPCWAERFVDRTFGKPFDVDLLLGTVAELCH